MTDAPTRAVLDGRYELRHRIDSDDRSELFLAVDHATDQPVAVTLLFPPYELEPSLVARFEAEVQVIARLDHPNIVKTLGWGSHGDTLFVVKEHVQGTPLVDLLASRGTLPATEAASIGADVAAVLAAAHRVGITHGDLTLSSIVIRPSGQAKVSDFGLVRAGSFDDDQSYAPGPVIQTTLSTLSTPTSSGPASSIEGPDNAGPRGDLRSLGVVLRQMAAGDQSLPPNVPTELRPIIDSLVAPDRASQLATAESIEHDLRRVHDGDAGAYVASVTAETDVIKVRPPPVLPRPNPRPGAGLGLPGFVATLLERDRPPMRPAAPQAEPPTEDFDELTNSPLFLVTVVSLLLLLGGVILYLSAALSGGSQGAGGDTLNVPTVVGDTQEVATARLSAAGLIVNELLVENDGMPAGIVFAQDPPSRAEIEVGDQVTISIAQAPDTVAMPDVVDMNRIEAGEQLSALGFSVEIRRQANDVVEADRVIEQSVRNGQEVGRGGEIILLVSSGPEQAIIPNLAGIPADQASLQLAELEFSSVRIEFEPSLDFSQGNVNRTEPPADSQIELTAPITVFVSTGDHDLVPGVIGLTRGEAEQLLYSQGFQLSVQEVDVDPDSGLVGVVLSQGPEPDALVPVGSHITLRVGRERTGFFSQFFPQDRGKKKDKD